MEIKNVSYEYNKINYKSEEVLENISIKFKKGQISSIIGKNGCGKTTLLNIISGEYPLANGILKLDNEKVAYVKEKPEFINNLVIDNFKDLTNNLKKIIDSLKMVNLNQMILEKKISKLSESEKKRISIALALITNPDVLILDEPTIGLDNTNKNLLYKILNKMNKRYNKTIIIASNDIEFVHKITDVVYVLNDKKITLQGNKYDIFKQEKILNNYGIEVPNVIKFSNLVLNKKNKRLGYRDEINDLMKDIYRNI